MKFDVVIGNPPYQEETARKETTNGQKTVKNIFQYFQIEADKICKDSTVLIYPGGRWIHQSGKGLKTFGLKQINDPHLSTLVFYPDANDVFKGPGISDGISIVYKNMNKNSKRGGFLYIYAQNGHETLFNVKYPGQELLPLNPNNINIIKKISCFMAHEKLPYLHESILPRSLFGIESNTVEENPEKFRLYTDDIKSLKADEIKIFTNDRAGKMGRAKWFIAKNSIIKNNRKYIYEWQVVVSSANAGGQKRDCQMAIIDNRSAFGRSRVGLKSFISYEEAKNFLKYGQSTFIRYTFLLTDENLSSLAKYVPDIKNYTNSNKFIDFNKDISQQFYTLLNFSEDEIKYIKEIVKNVWGNR